MFDDTWAGVYSNNSSCFNILKIIKPSQEFFSWKSAGLNQDRPFWLNI